MCNRKPARDRLFARMIVIVATGSIASLSACSLQSPYIRSVDTHTVNESNAVCPRDGNSGHLVALATEQQFEQAVHEHALFSNIVGEMLIPLAGIVAYRSTYKHGRNVLALATGGATIYGVSSYLYKKPQEEIYLTGVSALECAVRIADSQTLGDEDRAMLQALISPQTGTAITSQGPNASRLHTAAEQGKKLRDDADRQQQVAKDKSEYFTAGLTSLSSLRSNNTCKLSKSALTTVQQYLTDAQMHDQALQGRFQELDARLGRAESNARALLRKDAQVDQQLCHAADQIRTDVNHMLVTQTADLAKLASTISVLKFPDAAPQSSTPLSTSTPTPPGNSSGFGFEYTSNADSDVPEKPCAVENLNNELLSREKALSVALDAEQSVIEQVENSISAVTPIGALNDDLFAQCNVDTVAKPKPLAVTTGGDLSIEQGTSRQVLVSGGHPDYSAVLGNPPTPGAIAVKSGGDRSSGYFINISPNSSAAAVSYNIIVVDSAGATTSFTFKVIAKSSS